MNLVTLSIFIFGLLCFTEYKKIALPILGAYLVQHSFDMNTYVATLLDSVTGIYLSKYAEAVPQLGLITAGIGGGLLLEYDLLFGTNLIYDHYGLYIDLIIVCQVLVGVFAGGISCGIIRDSQRFSGVDRRSNKLDFSVGGHVCQI